MVPELGKPQVTEIQVRMDCNGCVQKIKKGLHGIKGIHDLFIDFPQQKVRVVGWADPQRILKAIKKMRKNATICHQTEPIDHAMQPTDTTPDATNPPHAEALPPAEPPKNPPPEVPPSQVAIDTEANQLVHPPGPKDVEAIHVVEQHPHDYSYIYGDYWNNHPNGHGFQPETPIDVTNSYNTCKPFPYFSECSYLQSPQHTLYSWMEQYSDNYHKSSNGDYYNTCNLSPYISNSDYPQSPHDTHYSRMEHYREDYHNSSNGDENITLMFSDENPNACTIV